MPLPVRAATLALACLCALFALWVRAENAIGVRYDVPGTVAEDGAPATAWGSYDPDTLYHVRRVVRAVENRGWVTAFDPLLDHPHAPGSSGTAIPWPPAYDMIVTGLVRGDLPDFASLFVDDAGTAEIEPLGPEARSRIEQIVSTLPMVCGTLAALFAALFAAGLAGRLAREEVRTVAVLAAALFAGLSVAATFGHVRYSHLGNGDHHAFVSLLHLLLLGLVGRALTRERIGQPIWSVLRGGVAGAIAGLLVTSWTASILWVALVQLALGLRLLVPFPSVDSERNRASARGLPLFATSFHKTALLVLVPAVIESPFSTTAPFSLVELSWFHMAWLAAGWLVFAPYALMPRFATKRRLVTAIPALFLVVLVLALTDAVARLADAFSWAGATNVFMGSITESQPLVGAGGSFAALVKFAGIGVLLGPVVWVFALRRTARAPELLPWVVTLPVLLVLAVLQRRFAEVQAAPLAVLLGAFLAVGAVTVLRDSVRASGPARIGVVLGLTFLALFAHPWTLRNTWSRMGIRTSTGERFVTVTTTARTQRAQTELLHGLARNGDDGRAVLAEWDLGHAIEWRAQRPTVATNFGLYLGEASFLAPWRFFAETDDERARKILETRDVGLVLIDGSTSRRRTTIAGAVGYEGLAGPLWHQTMAARLLGESAGVDGAAGVPGYLRLVRLVDDPGAGTMRIYEVVRGAELRATARSLSVAVTLEGQDGASATWRRAIRAASGEPEPLVLRIPYSTGADAGSSAGSGAFGAVHVRALEVFVDGVLVPLEFPESAVEEGLQVEVSG